MKNSLSRWFVASAFKVFLKPGIFLLTLAVLLIQGAGCKKQRLFSRADSVANIRPQFHLFNSFSYDTTLSLSVDGLLRVKVPQSGFSPYYPFSNIVKLNTLDPGTRLISISDATLSTRYTDSLSLAFKPNTSYLVLIRYDAYNLVNNKLKENVKPHLVFIPEEVYHPYAGYSKLRFLNLAAGNPLAELQVSPNKGSGTIATFSSQLQPLASTGPLSGGQYILTDPGAKILTLLSDNLRFVYKVASLEESKAYSVITQGDLRNWQRGLEGLPKLFLVEEGSGKAQEVPFDRYQQNNSENVASFRIFDAAYNIHDIYNANGTDPYPPNVLSTGATIGGDFANSQVRVNNRAVGGLNYFFTRSTDGPPPNFFEFIGSAFFPGDIPVIDPITFHYKSSTIGPGNVLITALPSSFFSPILARTSLNAENGKAYTVLLEPLPGEKYAAGIEVVENDISPELDKFKLRLVNLMTGASSVDLHADSPSGPILIGDIQYGRPSAYSSFLPVSGTKKMFLTASGSTDNLFKSEPRAYYRTAIELPFKAGNNGTMFVTGTLDPTDVVGPDIEFHNEVYLDLNNRVVDATLKY